MPDGGTTLNKTEAVGRLPTTSTLPTMRTEFCALSALATAAVVIAAAAPPTSDSAAPIHIPLVQRRSATTGTPERFGAVADQIRGKYGLKLSASGLRKRAGNSADITIIDQVRPMRWPNTCGALTCAVYNV